MSFWTPGMPITWMPISTPYSRLPGRLWHITCFGKQAIICGATFVWGLVSGLLKGLKLEGLDTGDVLLLLILLFLFLEGDDMELVITLGLLLLLGLE